MKSEQSFLMEIVDKLRLVQDNTTDGETSSEIEDVIDFILQSI